MSRSLSILDPTLNGMVGGDVEGIDGWLSIAIARSKLGQGFNEMM